MATINQDMATLPDLLKNMQDGSPVRRVAELASRNSELLRVLPMMAANGNDGHAVVYQSALPRPTWVKHNEGVAPTKGASDSYVESFGRAEQRFAIASSLVERNGGQFLKSQQVSMAIEGMRQEVVESILYSSTLANPQKFTGLIPRLDKLSGQWSKQIINHTPGAAGNDQATILLVKPGENGVHLIYPPGTPAGLEYKKLSEDYEDDGSGTNKKVLCNRGHFIWNVGVAVEDARSLVRIGNIDMSALSTTGDSLINAMIDASETMSSTAGAFFLMPKALRGYLRKQKNDSRSPISIADVEGVKQVMFDNIPIYVDEMMLLTESPLQA
ncbi:MAG: hypothetical protein DI536_04220 [Archangium gephyra]|uniref:Phage major capsid protein n=1 Tax=Archangium gephyra TaxID=48 RepID=A0A2W5U1V1_9BACT|nr:MAG: hypothetical protein DI536_04220 [Archangium gephyra]